MTNASMDTKPLSNADIDALSGYLSGALSAADADAVEQRLVDDEQFYNSATPYIKLWRADVWHEPKKRTLTVRRGVLLAAAAVVLVTVLPLTAFGTAVQESSRLGQVPVGVSDPRLGTEIATGHGETRVVTLPGGSTVRLAPMSRLTYRRAASYWRGYVVTLSGTGVIDVRGADRPLYVGTMRGEATLFAGRYEVRCDIGCTALQVTTMRGMALLSNGTPLGWHWVGAGALGAVSYPWATP